jgi:hypothetical protein
VTKRLNQFTGASDKTLKTSLAQLKKALADFYADPDSGGGGSPTEGLRDRIADLEEEIERRKANDLAISLAAQRGILVIQEK